MDKRKRLLELLREKAVLRGRFVLASGKVSDRYVDCRRVTLDAEGAELVGELVFAEVLRRGATAVAGLTMGADPIVVATGLVARRNNYPLKMAIVRKEPKRYGTAGQVEGPPLERGDRVVVVEDVATTGASALKAAQVILRQFNCRIAAVLALVDRNEGAEERIQRHGLEFIALFEVEELL